MICFHLNQDPTLDRRAKDIIGRYKDRLGYVLLGAVNETEGETEGD